MRHLIFSLLILLCLPAPSFAQTVRAIVDRNQVNPGETVSLRVVIDGGSGQVNTTGIKDFKVLSQGTSSKTQFINGRTTRELIYNFALIPLKEGSLTIPALPVEIDDAVFYTQKISIKVTDALQDDTGPGDVFVSARVSDQQPFEGQQIQYIFRFHNAVEVANAQFQKPDFKGFESQELKDRHSFRNIIKGREYVVTELVFILIPDGPGKKTIDPAVLHCGIVQTSNDRGSPFSGMDTFFNRRQVRNRMFRTTPIPVDVRPLPLKKDADFSGLVGTFDILANMDSNALSVGDSATLTVTVKGKGNIRDAGPPAILLPEGLKTYTDNPEEAIQIGREGFYGKKVFRTAIVPVNPGEFVIPGIRLTYFDIETKAYATKKTPPFTITVRPSTETEKDLDVYRADKAGPDVFKKEVAFTGRDILPLKEDLRALETDPPLTLWSFILYLLLPLLGYGGIILFYRSREKDSNPSSIMARRAKKAISKARKANFSNDVSLSLLYKALVASILSKAGVMGEAITWSEAEKQLLACGCAAETARSCAMLLETIESCNYSGGCLDHRAYADLLKKTEQMVKELCR